MSTQRCLHHISHNLQFGIFLSKFGSIYHFFSSHKQTARTAYHADYSESFRARLAEKKIIKFGISIIPRLDRLCGSVGVAKVLGHKFKCPNIVDCKKKIDVKSLSQTVGVHTERVHIKISAADPANMKHRTLICKQFEENFFNEEEVSQPHVGERIKRVSKVDLSKM